MIQLNLKLKGALCNFFYKPILPPSISGVFQLLFFLIFTVLAYVEKTHHLLPQQDQTNQLWIIQSRLFLFHQHF